MAESLFSIAHYADQFVLAILVSLSVLSLAIIIERWFYLNSISADAKHILSKVEKALKENRMEEMKETMSSENDIFASISSMSINHIDKYGEHGLDEVFNTYSITMRPKLERFLSFLGTIGSNPPYIGLLGTVLGIMKAFHDMTQTTNEAGQKVVMAGISIALVATATGLAVAIPSVAFYNFFNKKVQSIFDTLSSLKEFSLAYAKSTKRKQ